MFFRDYGCRLAKADALRISILSRLSIPSSTIRRIVVGGEELTKQQISVVAAIGGIVLFNEYGPTEATVGCVVKRIDARQTVVPIGKPIANTRIYIADAAGELCPAGVVGEICIVGVGVSRGYLNRPALNEDKFIPNTFSDNPRLYKTGDLGYWGEDGELFCLGRNDKQVKVRGYRIELGEIESRMFLYPSMREVVVVVKNVANTVMHISCAFYTED